MTIPAGVTTVTVTGNLGAAGVAATGYIEFTPSVPVAYAVAGWVNTAAPFTATLTDDGSFSIVLPATDCANGIPTSWTYRVTEHFEAFRAPFDTEIALANGDVQDYSALGTPEPVAEPGSPTPSSPDLTQQRPQPRGTSSLAPCPPGRLERGRASRDPPRWRSSGCYDLRHNDARLTDRGPRIPPNPTHIGRIPEPHAHRVVTTGAVTWRARHRYLAFANEAEGLGVCQDALRALPVRSRRATNETTEHHPR